MKIAPLSLLLATSIPFALFAPRSEAIMQKESFENKQTSLSELIASGCHAGAGGGNNLHKREDKAAIQAELKEMFDELESKKD